MQTMHDFYILQRFRAGSFMQVYTECHLYIGNFVMYYQCMGNCTCCTAVNTTMQVIECMGVAAPVLAITTKSAFTDTSSSTRTYSSRRNWNTFPGKLINHVI